MAKAYWPGETALDRCVVVAEPQCRTVIGVVADARQTRLEDEHRHQLYLTGIADPRISTRLPRTLVIRSPHPLAIAATVRRAVSAVDPSLSYVTVRPLEELIAPKTRPWRLGATVLGAFGAFALVLAAFGLYGSMSYVVSQRTHEIGLRMALGATEGQVTRLVLFRALLVCLAGIGFGMVGVLWGGQRIASLLFDVGPRDIAVIGLAVLTLAVAALMACYIPVRRALRIEPSEALRLE